MLEVRPVPVVLLAYAAAPVASLFLFWLGISIFETSIGRYSVTDDLSALPYLIGGGSAVGLVIEALLVTPVLIAFHRYRWSWLNGWWIAGYGLVIGEAAWALFEVFVGPRHWFGWGAVLQGTSADGFVGLSAAVVFQIVAFRRASAAP